MGKTMGNHRFSMGKPWENGDWYGTSTFLMGKSTINLQMAKFNSCVSLLEGIQVSNGHDPWFSDPQLHLPILTQTPSHKGTPPRSPGCHRPQPRGHSYKWLPSGGRWCWPSPTLTQPWHFQVTPVPWWQRAPKHAKSIEYLLKPAHRWVCLKMGWYI